MDYTAVTRSTAIHRDAKTNKIKKKKKIFWSSRLHVPLENAGRNSILC
jgi:hypothetical protein